ncbi:hypothetical protein TIFTF001_036432 [Ficus carica]|uniref:Uncharacterized protein n=1 Tax=Ficus carica TaxID=3494 RepID=A0AA88E3C8_FICCA|nr:hypothetical protein TIFTF001_036432 [Ficus carica]
MSHLSPLFIGAQTVGRESLGAGSTSRLNSNFEFPAAGSPSRQPRDAMWSTRHVANSTTRGELYDTANSTTTPPRTSEYPCSRPLACSRDKDSPSLTADRGMHPWSRPAQRCWGAYVDDPTISDYRPSFSARIAVVLGTHFVETITYGIRCLGGYYSGYSGVTSPHQPPSRVKSPAANHSDKQCCPFARDAHGILLLTA